MNVPAECAAEAAVIYAGYEHRYYDNKAVEDWADDWIAELGAPPTELLDLSILRDANPVDVLNLLQALATGNQLSIDAEIGLVGVMYQQRLRSLRSLINGLFELVYRDDVDDDTKGIIYYLDDGLDLAEQGVYGAVDQVEQEFASLVTPYAENLRQQFPHLFGPRTQ